MKQNYKAVLAAFELLMLSSLSSRAQSVGIGPIIPISSAVLDLQSPTNNQVLVPRLTAAQRTAIMTPIQSLLMNILQATTCELVIRQVIRAATSIG